MNTNEGPQTIHLPSGGVTSTADAADAFLPREVITEAELQRALHRPAPDHALWDVHSAYYRLLTTVPT